jgi:putative phosphoesterase
MPKTAVVHNTEALTDDNFAYLRSMRSQYRDRIDGLELYMVHGSPNNKFRDYVHDVDDTIFEAFEHPPDVLILGHTHIPLNTLHDHTLVINPGSVGQPRDGNPDASYAILDTETREATHHRVTYDIDATADKTKDEIAVKYGTRLYEGK